MGFVLGRLQFCLTYCPSSRNLKPDALSRQFALPEENTTEETILLSSFVIGAARWEVEKVVQQAERTHAPPLTARRDCCLFHLLFTLVFCSGDMTLTLPATLPPSSASIFGGQL